MRQEDIWALRANWYDAEHGGYTSEVAYFRTKRDAEAVGEELRDRCGTEQEYEFTVTKVVPWESSRRPYGQTIEHMAATTAKEWDLP